MDAALTLCGVLVVGLGLVLLAVPAAPAVGVIFAGVALVAWADDFARIGWASMGVLLALTVVGSLADNAAALFGARRAGASAWGVTGAAIGMLAGIPFGVPGLVVGSALGAFVLEFTRNPDVRRAGKAGVGGVVGVLLGIVARSAFGLLIVGLALLAYLL